MRPETETLLEGWLHTVEGCVAGCTGQLVLEKETRVNLKSLFLGEQAFQRRSPGTVVQSWGWVHNAWYGISTFV